MAKIDIPNRRARAGLPGVAPRGGLAKRSVLPAKKSRSPRVRWLQSIRPKSEWHDRRAKAKRQDPRQHVRPHHRGRR